MWNGRALDDGAVSDYIRQATAKLKDGADITKATDGAAADGAAAAFSAAIDGAGGGARRRLSERGGAGERPLPSARARVSARRRSGGARRRVGAAGGTRRLERP